MSLYFAVTLIAAALISSLQVRDTFPLLVFTVVKWDVESHMEIVKQLILQNNLFEQHDYPTILSLLSF